MLNDFLNVVRALKLQSLKGTVHRFGWFLPERFARATPPIKDHWRALTTEDVAGLFALDAAADRALVEAALRGPDGRYVGACRVEHVYSINDNQS